MVMKVKVKQVGYVLNSSASVLQWSFVYTSALNYFSRCIVVYFIINWQVFQLATASRHLIYSGSLMLAETRQLTPLFVVLMSDLLLLTRPDPDNGSLVVLAQPLSLQDIVGSNFHCSHRK